MRTGSDLIPNGLARVRSLSRVGRLACVMRSGESCRGSVFGPAQSTDAGKTHRQATSVPILCQWWVRSVILL